MNHREELITAIQESFRTMDTSQHTGVLSDLDIRNEIFHNRIIIHPFCKDQLTPLGYDLTPSGFVLSTKTGIPLKLMENHGEIYVWVDPHDTVLIHTNESLYINKKLMGILLSKNSVAALGFTHITTTLAPDWQGPLLITMSNPTHKRIKLLINDSQGSAAPFVTLTFQYFHNDPLSKANQTGLYSDILNQYAASPKRNLSKVFLGKSYREFRELLDIMKSASILPITENGQSNSLQEAEKHLRLLEASIQNDPEALPDYWEAFQDFIDASVLLQELPEDFTDSLAIINTIVVKYMTLQMIGLESYEMKTLVFHCIHKGLEKCSWQKVGAAWYTQRKKIQNRVQRYSSHPSRLRFFLGKSKRRLLSILGFSLIMTAILLLREQNFIENWLALLASAAATLFVSLLMKE